MHRSHALHARAALVVALAAALVAALLVAVPSALAAGDGELQVTTSPSVDAEIRVNGEPRNRSALAGLPMPAGEHVVCFAAVEGYLPPPCETVEVAAGETTEVEGRFEPAGWLEATTEPASLGAAIEIDGAERDRGSVRLPMAVGDHEVCFGEITGHSTPGCITVRVTADETTEVVGDYHSGTTRQLSNGPHPDTDGSIAAACPNAAALGRPFPDVASDSPHAQAIACAVEWGVVSGRPAGEYAPDGDVTRAQVATMIHGLLEASDLDLSGIEPRGFADARGSVHEDAISLLAGVGVIEGRTDGTFGPSQPIRRDQMASILARAMERGFGLTSELGPSFSDVNGGVHAANIRRLVGAGVTQGTTSTTYAPGRDVGRDQMASFVMRTADNLVESGQAQPPATVLR